MSWKILANLDEYFVRADITYYVGLAEDEKGKQYPYYYKHHDQFTLFRNIGALILYLSSNYRGIDVVFFDEEDEMDKYIEGGGLEPDKTPRCDWCESALSDLPDEERYQQWYYADSNQAGRLCFDCHVKEMCHSNDAY